MTAFGVSLSSAAIKNIIVEQIQEDFEFVVGGHGYKCGRIVAEFLSPRVCLSHSVDQSIGEYFVEASDSNDQFKLFISLGSGSAIPITKANLDFFLCLSREFGNSSVHNLLLEHFDGHFLSCQVPDSTTLNLFSEALIGRISSNFFALTLSELDAISVSVLFHILSHDLLKLSTEDSLFSYISSRVCSDPKSLDLLRFVRFECLSAECISDFFSALPDSIDRRLWESISRRLISHIPHAVGFPLQEAKSLDGIISCLTRKHGGNVHEKEIVTITSKSIYSDKPTVAVRNVADLTSRFHFLSKNGPGQWICWDFHEMRVRPTHYTITSFSLKSWVVESSLDGESWTEIDRKKNNQDFKAHAWETGLGLKMASFAVSNSAECRSIRLTQTGKNHRGDDYLVIWAFEVFGTLLE
jgi:hypothetical protein